jgi:group I intron endonuclease
MFNLFNNYQNFPKESGIYKITTIHNNCFYIGSALSLKKRMKDHRNCLKNNMHHSSYIQNVYNKYGQKNFKVEFLETESFNIEFNSINHKKLLEKEEMYILKLNPRYNIIKTPTTQKNNPSTSKKVYQYTKEGLFIKEWVSMREVTRQLGIQIQNGLRTSNSSKSSGGYQWSFNKIDKLPSYKSNSGKTIRKSVSIYDLFGVKISTHLSIQDCIIHICNNNVVKISRNEITNYIKNSKAWNNNYRFAYGQDKTLDNTINSKHKKGYLILQFDLTSNFINIWGNTEIAHKTLGLSSIYDNISKKTKQCGGYIWKKL